MIVKQAELHTRARLESNVRRCAVVTALGHVLVMIAFFFPSAEHLVFGDSSTLAIESLFDQFPRSNQSPLEFWMTILVVHSVYPLLIVTTVRALYRWVRRSPMSNRLPVVQWALLSFLFLQNAVSMFVLAVARYELRWKQVGVSSLAVIGIVLVGWVIYRLSVSKTELDETYQHAVALGFLVTGPMLYYWGAHTQLPRKDGPVRWGLWLHDLGVVISLAGVWLTSRARKKLAMLREEPSNQQHADDSLEANARRG